MTVIFKKPKACFLERKTISLSQIELNDIYMCINKKQKAKILVHNSKNEVEYSIPRSKFRDLQLKAYVKGSGTDVYYVADFSRCI
jgi:hypothetical protein